MFDSTSLDSSTKARYKEAGFGKSSGYGKRPALLVIDVQYRTTGSKSVPYETAVKEYPTAVGEDAWNAVENIQILLDSFRAKELPVLYPYVAPKQDFDEGVLGAKIPNIMNISREGYKFPEEVAPLDGEVLIPKKHPSAFFGTPLASYLIQEGVDTLVVTGCSTSGCVRSTVVDAFSYNFKVLVPENAVYDRSPLIHDVNLFDIDQKYGDVRRTADILKMVDNSQAHASV